MTIQLKHPDVKDEFYFIEPGVSIKGNLKFTFERLKWSHVTQSNRTLEKRSFTADEFSGEYRKLVTAGWQLAPV